MKQPFPIIQTIGFGKPINERYSPLCNFWYENGQWHSERLFVVATNMIYYGFDISPNYRYWYHCMDKLYLGVIGERRYRVLSKVGHLCAFSPNSRYLAGYKIGEGHRGLSVYEMPSGKRVIQIAPPIMPPRMGWYPDSRRIWYGGKQEGYYQLNVVTRRVRRLTAREVSKLDTDWFLLNPRFRPWTGDLTDRNRYYVYSSNGQVRLGTPPYYWYRSQYERYGRIVWRPQEVWVEWRNGRRVRIWRNTRQGVRLMPSGVSDDGRWAIVSLAQMDEQEFNPLKVEIWVFDISSRKRVWQWARGETDSDAVPQNALIPYHFGPGSILRRR